jgi:hypothetical protein
MHEDNKESNGQDIGQISDQESKKGLYIKTGGLTLLTVGRDVT